MRFVTVFQRLFVWLGRHSFVRPEAKNQERQKQFGKLAAGYEKKWRYAIDFFRPSFFLCVGAKFSES